MKARTRRLLALAGGCLAGAALGRLAATINPYMRAAMLHADANPQGILLAAGFWIPCLSVGILLGAALAAVIPGDPAPDRT
jgi:hypothetical protein